MTKHRRTRREASSPLSRRGLLRGAAGVAAWGTAQAPVFAGGSWLLRLAGCDDEVTRAKDSGKTLVVVFLRGGADGLNVVVPHADDDYHRMRPGLAIGRPGQNGGALDLGGGFGLHPALAPLMPLARDGTFTALHAVGHPDNTRSHFEEQDRWELAHPEADLGTEGWLARYLAAAEPRGPIRSIALGERVPRSLRGKVKAVALPGLDTLTAGSSDLDAAMRALERAYGGKGGASALEDTLGSGGETTLEAMRRLGEVARVPFEAKGEYPDHAFGRRMREVARIVRADLGVEVIQLELSGFDTHRDQAQPLAQLLGVLGQSFAALHADLGERARDTLVLTVSEFGRTARVNGTRGTDHGGGSCVLALGGALRLKDGTPRGVLGDWPTLAREALHQDRELRVATDVRDVYGEVLTRFLGLEDPSTVLPGWTPSPVGLIPRSA